VLTGDQARAAVRDDVTSDARTLVSLVAFFSMVAVLVGMFVIANTFSVLVAQRTRELALLRALGAGRRQISRSVRAESLLLGVVLSVVGATGGVLAVHLVALTARTAGRPLPLSAGVIVPWWSLAVGGGVTALATVLAARGAARRASRVAPIEALTEAAQGDAPLSRTRWVLTALLTGVIALMATSEEWMVLAALLLAAPAVLLGPATPAGRQPQPTRCW
jgi:putative ABC transport system permease protein